MSNDVIFINRKYLNSSEKNQYIRSDISDEELSKIWANYNWKEAEKTIFNLQCFLTKLTFMKDKSEIKRIQNKITSSSEAKMLAVRKVSEELKSSAGIDGVRWRTNADKMRAAISLTCNDYHAKPFRHFEFQDKKSNKTRHVGVPCLYDRAMHVLYSYALDPVAEATADQRSFGFRKNRSALHAHALLSKTLKDKETGDWILVADVQSYYANISHDWLLENIPLNSHVLKEFIKVGMIFENGELFPVDKRYFFRLFYFAYFG